MSLIIDLTKKQLTNFSDFLTEIQAEPSNKIKLYEYAVEYYKFNRDRKAQLYEENEALQKEIDNIKSSVNSSEDLIKIKDRVEFELSKFNDILADQNLKQRVFSLKLDRITNIAKILKNLASNLMGQNDKPNEIRIVYESLVVGQYLYFLIFASLLIATSIFVLVGNLTVVIVAGVLTMLYIFLFVLMNLFNHPILDTQDIFKINYLQQDTSHYQRFVQNLSSQDNALFVNAAWVDALFSERQKVLNALQVRLGGKTFEEIDQGIQSLETKIYENNEEMNRVIDLMISAEDYLKLRRELDILKIENDKTEESNIDTLQLSGIEGLPAPLRTIITSFLNYIKEKGYVVEVVYG